jgi:hypothetical protein
MTAYPPHSHLTLFNKEMEATTSLEAKLSIFEQKLEAAEADLLAHRMSPEVYTALAAHLREEKKALKDEIAKARNPVPAPAPAPPGNCITLPQVLPLSFFCFSSSFPPPSHLLTPTRLQSRLLH